MEQKYEIKGIDKILSAVSREDLAKAFEVSPDEDFEQIITEDLREMGIPSGLEVAGYERTNYEDLIGGKNRTKEICDKYTNDGKAVMGINYGLTGDSITELYFYIDEPIKDEDVYSITRTQLGGVSTLGYTMGREFYETHKDEMAQIQEEASQTIQDRRAFDEYVRNYFNRLSGKEEIHYNLDLDWEREMAEEAKKRTSRAEALISELTGGKSIDEVTLQDLEKIKQALEERANKVREAFAKKFGTRESVSEK